MTASQAFIDAVRKLLAAVQSDAGEHGGLLTRDTIRAADELRLELSRVEKASGGTT